jgi:uncharacterized protein (TIRG00374 family)
MKLFEKIAFAAGVALLGWLVYRIGPGNLWEQLSELSWGFFLVFGLHAVVILCNALAWRSTLPPARRSVPLGLLSGMLIAGDAVNAVTPAAVVGGNLVRISLLGRRVPLEAAVGSVGLAAMALFVAQALFVVSGAPFVFTVLQDGSLRAGLALLSAAVLLLVSFILYLGWSPEGLARIRRWFERFGWFRVRWTAPESRWRAFAEETLGSLRNRPRDFVLSVGLSLLGWLTGIVEVFLILRLLKAPVGWGTALAIEVLSVTIEGVLFFVPAKMGTQEGGKYVIFLALALDPVKGVALGFIRRLRELAWAAVGLALLGILQSSRTQPQPLDASSR